MPYVEARGLNFHVQDLGADHLPPVLMLHGLFSGSLASWWFTSGPAVARDHHVRLIDLRGHGLSDRPLTGYDRATMRADVLALTDDLGPFAVVGHSYGAVLGLDLAGRHPERVTALAAVEAPLVDLPGAGRDATLTDRQLEARTRDRDAHPLEATSLVADVSADPVIADADLRALSLPMLFLFGEDSGYVGGADRVRRVRPDVRCEVLGGGHNLHVDAREQVTERLVAFLDGPNADEVAYG